METAQAGRSYDIVIPRTDEYVRVITNLYGRKHKDRLNINMKINYCSPYNQVQSDKTRKTLQPPARHIYDQVTASPRQPIIVMIRWFSQNERCVGAPAADIISPLTEGFFDARP